MDCKPPHHHLLQSQNPTNTDTNTNNPTHHRYNTSNLGTSQDRKPKLKGAMDKFGEVVRKLANSDPNRTLTGTQKSLIGQRLTEFFRDFHTPDHPPYAAMIHRAIRELNEKVGSNEESISKFIKKEYVDLPWAHFTLLKHHLGKLCDYGEIVVTRDQCYMLADANPKPNSNTRPKREQLKRKPRWDRRRGRSKRRKKDETWGEPKQKEEQMEVIEEQNQELELTNEVIEEQIEADEQQNQPQKQQNDVTKEQNQPKEQKFEVIERHKARREIFQSCDDGENGVGNDLRVLPSESPRQMLGEVKKENLEEVEQQQQQKKSPCVVGEVGDIYGLHAQQKREGNAICVSPVDLNMDSEQLEKENRSELSSPERPPGFDLTIVEELSLSQEQQTVVELSQSQEQHSVLPNPYGPLETCVEQKVYKSRLTTATSTDIPMDSQQFEPKEQLEFSNPEGPPGFCGQQKSPESAPTETASLPVPVNRDLVEQEQHMVVSDSERPSDVEITTVEEPEFSGTVEVELTTVVELSESQEQHSVLPNPYGHPETCVEQKPYESQLTTTTSTDIPVDLQQFELEEQPEFSNPEGPQALCGQQKPPESAPTTETASLTVPVNLDLVEQEQHMVVLDTERPSEVELTTVDELSYTLLQIKEEQRQQRQLQGQRRRQAEYKLEPLATMMELLPLQHQQQQPELSNPEALQEVKSTAVEELSKQHRAKQRGRRKRTKSQPKEMITQDVHMNSEQIEEQQLSELPNPEKSLELELTTVELLSQEQQQQPGLSEGKEAPESQPGIISLSYDLPMDPKQPHQVQEPDISVPERPIELELVAVEQSFQTERLQRQLRRWSLRLSEPKPAATSMVELLPSSRSEDQHLPQPELPNSARPQELKQAPVGESTQITEQRAKLRSWRKRNTSQPTKATDSLDSPLALQHLEPEQRSELPNPEKSLELEPLKEFSQQQRRWQQQAAQEKPPRRQLRPRPPKFEPATAASMAKLLPSQHQKPELPSRERSPEQEPSEELSQHLHQQQQQTTQEKPPRRQLRPRPPKPEPATAATMAELLPSQHQHEEQQQPERLRRGRPPKPKPDTTTVGESMPSDNRNQHEQKKPAPRGRGRPPKVKLETATTEEVLFLANSLNNPQQEQQLQQQQEEEDQPKHRGRGRPPKPKPATGTTMKNLRSSKKQQQLPKCQGRGRPRKMDQGK